MGIASDEQRTAVGKEEPDIAASEQSMGCHQLESLEIQCSSHPPRKTVYYFSKGDLALPQHFKLVSHGQYSIPCPDLSYDESVSSIAVLWRTDTVTTSKL